MEFTESLRKNKDFQAVYRKGHSCVNKYLVMYVMDNQSEKNRLGISVSKKVGNSVVRHRLKRLIRESYRLHEQEFQTGLDIVVVARVSAKDRDYAQIESALLHLGKIRKIVKEMKREDDEADINETIKKNVLRKKDNKTNIEIEGNVDVTKLGKYDIKIVASRKKKHISRKVAVKVVDTQAPVISLSGDTEITLEAGSNYEEAGFSAVDNYDGDITDKVETSAEVDTYTTGDTTIVYSVKDSSGNEAFTERVIHVEDTTAPQISLTGGEVYYIRMGDTYSEPGYIAVDMCDGDVTDKVSVSGNVDTANAGKYTVTYNVSDNCGNESEVQRIVKVVAPMSDDAVNPGDKVVYLTFDDGPGPYTEKLLDILDRYNVKATFFVTNGKPDYQNLIAQEAQRGHTVAIHSASHDYAKIYQSVDAYFADFDEMNSIITAQTGKAADLVRFPGGSSNTISKKYCYGIMSQLVCAVEERGFRYCDWNVSSGDAGGTTSTSQVVANVIEGIKSNNVSVVLQHDIKNFSVDAVEQIIQWGLSEGYTFLPMTSTTPMSHHGVNN